MKLSKVKIIKKFTFDKNGVHYKGGYIVMKGIKETLSTTRDMAISARTVSVFVAIVILISMNLAVYQERRKLDAVRLKAEQLESQIKDIDSKISKINNTGADINTKIDNVSKILEEYKKTITDLQGKTQNVTDQQQKDRRTLDLISRGGMDMRATAYDLTVESCGKRPSNSEYGITRSGTVAEAGRTVAVDPDTIPLGSKLFIKFPDKYNYLNGVYVAEDTGGAVQGDIIDIFLGENEPEVDNFGAQPVKVFVMRRGW